MTVSLEAERPRRGGGAEGVRGAPRLGSSSSRSSWTQLWVALACLRCGGMDLTDECGSLAAGEVTVATWWDGGDSSRSGHDAAEVRARRVLEQQFQECNPAASVKSEELPNKQALINEIPRVISPRATIDAAGRSQSDAHGPWDVVLLNGGADVARFSGCDAADPTQATSPRLIPISELGDALLLERPFPADIMQSVRCQEKHYALPVGMHRLNSLYFNRPVLEVTGCFPRHLQSASAGEFRAIVADLHEVFLGTGRPSGETCVSAVPGAADVQSVFAIATDEPWAVSLFAIENLMVSSVGVDGYLGFWRGHRGDPRGEHDLRELATTLETLAFYRELLSKGAWQEPQAKRDVQWTFEQVRAGQAVFTVMGDWQSKDAVDDVLGEVAFPGTQDAYVYTTDAFAVPVDAPNRAAALAWLRSVTSRRAQERYVPVKGGVSAREDTWGPPEGVRTAPGMPLLIPANSFDLLAEKLAQSLSSTQDVHEAELLEYVAHEYCKLSEAATFCSGVPKVK